MIRRVAKIAAVATLMTMLPAAAFAVKVSSNDGSGTQSKVESYANGADVTGTLRSTSAKGVYYSGKVALSSCEDKSTGRYTSNTTSTSAVTRGGTITTGLPIGWPCGYQGVKSKVCRDITALPDACGSDSTTY